MLLQYINSACIQYYPSTWLEMVTDTVPKATNIFSLVTKNSGLVTTLPTKLNFLYDLDLN